MDKTRLNFRIKVDLTKFFDDHRRTSWVFVETSTILNVKHLKEHIAKLFDIKEPFYLLCDSTYLPFKEDVRILNNDNFVSVIRGNVEDRKSNSVGQWQPANSQRDNISQVSSAQASTYDEKEVQTDLDNQAELSDQPNGDVTMTVASDVTIPEPTTANNTMYHSILEESEINSATDSKVSDSLLTEDYSFDLNTPAKRKRSRKKRVKRLDSESTNRQNTSEETLKKPKIIEQIVFKSGKHIRFDGLDDERSQSSNNSCISDFQNRFCLTPGPKNSSSKDLNTLLTLKQCSTPLTFSCKKPGRQMKLEKPVGKSIDEDEENLTESARNIVVPNGTNQIEKNADLQIENIDPKKYPNLESNPKVNDVIAFKLFKMDENYTPQISCFIIGKVLDIHPVTYLCTIKVLRGQGEIEEPKGKLSLPMDEEEPTSDVIKLTYNQLLEPRLITRNQ